MEINEQSIIEVSKKIKRCEEEISKGIIGQKDTIRNVLIAIFAEGNVLLEGMPGMGKTQLVKTIGKVLDLNFSRIQFTPDLMPADVVGTNIVVKENDNTVFKFEKGPVFTNLLLADEINRATPKTQSALLEAMGEKTVTVGKTTYEMPKPFMVLATQNPIEQEGTYPLPEAQLDRFMFAIELDYPSFEEEVAVVKSTTVDHNYTVQPMFSPGEIIEIQKLIRRVPVADNVVAYAVNLVGKTRPNSPLATPTINEYVDWGAGPRASQNLILAAKAHALIRGKFSPDIEDVQAVSLGILRHRVLKNYKAEAENISIDSIITSLF